MKQDIKPSTTESFCKLLGFVVAACIGVVCIILIYKLGIWLGDCGHTAEGYFNSLVLLTLSVLCLFLILPVGFLAVTAISYGVSAGVFNHYFNKNSKDL